MLSLIRKVAGTARLESQVEQLTATVRTAEVRRSRLRSQRSFKAAVVDRLQSSWNPSGQSNDSAIRMGLRKMRQRSRELYYNNEYAKHYCRLLKNNVVGSTGIRLQVKAKDADGTLDRKANRIIEAAWQQWGKRGVCDVTGKLSWIDILCVALETTSRDGELLIRKVRGFDNAFGFALQLIEADHLDETLNAQLPGGNVIRMGIEFDKWDRPVAYHLLRRHPGDYIYGHQRGGSHERVPASDIIHLHLAEFVRQSRGVPWLHAAMARLKKIDSYEWSELVASTIASNKMAFYEPDPEADPPGEGEEDEGEFIEESEAGTFGIVPQGYRLKEFDPQHPAGNYDPFMKRMMRGFSSGGGLSYVSIGNDLSEVNFSSIRFGTEEDRDFYKMLQRFLIEGLCDEVYPEWLPAAMLSGQVKLPFSKLEKFRSIVWRPRRWSYVNPIQDATAKDKQLKYGGLTLIDLHAEAGGDYEEYLEKLQLQQQLEDEYKVKPPARQEQPPAKG